MQLQGLTSGQVIENRQEYGVNLLTPPPHTPWWMLFLEKFNDPVVRILIFAAVLALFVGSFKGEYTEALGIIFAIILATVLAFVNEFKANQEFNILNQVNDEVLIKVIRNGKLTTVPKKDLVFGDIVLVEAGEEIPADGRVLEAVSLQVDESSLTGESVPVNKIASKDLRVGNSQGEAIYQPDKVLRSTIVTDGYGTIEITAVGDRTEIGETARAAAVETEEETPLNIQLKKLSELIGVLAFLVAGITLIAIIARGVIEGELNLTIQQWYLVIVVAISGVVAGIRVWLPVIFSGLELIGKDVEQPKWLEENNLLAWVKTISIGLIIFGLGLGLGYISGFLHGSLKTLLPFHIVKELLNYFMIAVTIIVVAVPEGLTMSVTLSLAYSMKKMTASNNLVRRLDACETIGAITVICSDKTGTLTQNEMRVQEVNFPSVNTKLIIKEQLGDAEEMMVEAICANTTAHLTKKPRQSLSILGNPTEGALLLWLDKKNINYTLQRQKFQMTNQWTFSSERKYMATLGISSTTGSSILHLKGAPEIILNRCSHILTQAGIEAINNYKVNIEQTIKSYQARGIRVLGFAYHQAPSNNSEVDVEQLAHGLIWLGFIALVDPVRLEVPSAIRACRRAGIMVKVVTGDNSETAKEIARQIGLWHEDDGDDKHITGKEFEKLNDEDATIVAKRVKVVSRARPLDKLRLVKLLQAQNEIVAVTGDGSNDAPALNNANVGLAMGKKGSSQAKEASDIILLDDSFTSIFNAVMWGRSLYQNIQRFILFQLTINVVAVGIALLGPFIGIKLPLTVAQMLWVNLIMDTFAALALATEPPSFSVMKRRPRNPNDFIITREMTLTILGTSIIFLVFLIKLLLFIQKQVNTEHYLSIFFSIFVFLQFWNLFNAKCFGTKQSAFSNLFHNKIFIVIASTIALGQFFIVQYGGSIFRTVPLSLKDWILIIGGTSLVLWIGELGRLRARLTSMINHQKQVI